MAAKQPKPKRRLPDLARKVEPSPELEWWLAHRQGLSERLYQLIMSDCAHQVAALHEFEGDPVAATRRKGEIIRLAILDADGRCFEATEEHLGPVKDYLAWKKPGDPSTSTIYKYFKSWPRAKRAAGVGLTHTPAATALRSDGTRKTPIGFKWSFDDRVRAVATWREHGCLGGMRLSSEDYIDFQQHRWPGLLPDYQRVTGRITYMKNGKKRKRCEYSWEAMNGKAEELALAQPEEFPVLATYVRQQNGVMEGKNGAVACPFDAPVAA